MEGLSRGPGTVVHSDLTVSLDSNPDPKRCVSDSSELVKQIGEPGR